MKFSKHLWIGIGVAVFVLIVMTAVWVIYDIHM